MDTLRADHLDIYGYGRDTTPLLDRIWSRGATVYDQSYAAAAYTQPSVTSILTGLRPSSHAFWGFGQWSGTMVTPQLPLSLPAWLRGRGYFAVLANANANTPWLNPAHDAAWSEYTKTEPPRYFDAAHVIGQARKMIASSGGRDLYLYLQFCDAHLPYDPPVYESSFFRHDKIGHKWDPQFDGIRADRVKQITPPVLDNMKNRYDAGIRYLDSQLGPFVGELMQKYPDHVIIFTADHGEGFLEHGEASHGTAMYNTEIRVPLIVADSATRHKGLVRSAALVSGLDIFPTIVERLAGNPANYDFDGRSILWTFDGSPHERNEPRVLGAESPYYNDDSSGFGRCWGMAYFYQPRWGDESGTKAKLTSYGERCAAQRFNIALNDVWFDQVGDKAQMHRLRPREAGASILNPQFEKLWRLPELGDMKTNSLTFEEIKKLKALGYLNSSN